MRAQDIVRENMRQYRLSINLNQSDFARLIYKTLFQYNPMEKGRTEITVTALERLIEISGHSIAWWWCEHEAMTGQTKLGKQRQIAGRSKG